MKTSGMQIRKWGGILSAFFLLWAVPAAADIYKYVDENGVMHFTNAPIDEKYQLFVSATSPVTSFFMSSKYDHYIALASRTYGLSFPLLKAMIKVESNFNPKAVSQKGAQGLMQLMPGTAKLMDVYDPFDPWENIMGGARYLREMLNRFDGRVPYALAGYNAGPGRVDQYKGIPPFRETQNYVKKVLAHYRHLKTENGE
ncbi:MAG: transglycosylase SLT domain-containing protein [Desulfococcaceae bacterium]